MAGEQLGEIRCDGCGGVAYVYRAGGKRNKLLYSRCVNCKTDQRSGEAIQAKFAAYMPIGTLESEAVSMPKPKPAEAVSIPEEAAGEFNPELDMTAAEAVSDTVSKPKKSRIGWVLGGMAAVGLGLLGLGLAHVAKA